MKKTTLLVLLLAPIALAGCQTIKAHNPFRHREPAYKAAQQERPLEVPPGMDQPPATQALVIPSVNGKSTAAAATQPGSATPSTGEAEAAPAAMTGPSLSLSDTPASAYHRVGLALQRGDVGQVTAHNDAAMTYDVAVDTTVNEKATGGFLSRMFHHDNGGAVAVKGAVTVSVVPQGSGSLVEASGNPDAAAQVMAVLRQRLQ